MPAVDDLVHVWRRIPADEVAHLERDPDAAALVLVDSEPDELFDVGRAWQAVHTLLTGSPWSWEGPAGDAVLGGVPLGDPSTYEPVRLLPPERVAAVAALLRDLEPEELGRRYDAGAFRQAEVYPDVWLDPEALGGFVLPAYRRLREFHADAAAAGDALLMQLR